MRRLIQADPMERMDMKTAKEHPWILSCNWSEENYTDSDPLELDDTQVDMSLDGPSFMQPSATSVLSDASGPSPTPPEPTPRRPSPVPNARASTSPGTRMVRGRKSNADLPMTSARSEPPVTRKGKRRAQSVEVEDEADVLPSAGQKKRKVAGRGSQEDVVDSSSVAVGRRSRGASLQRRRSARLGKDT